MPRKDQILANVKRVLVIDLEKAKRRKFITVNHWSEMRSTLEHVGADWAQDLRYVHRLLGLVKIEDYLFSMISLRRIYLHISVLAKSVQSRPYLEDVREMNWDNLGNGRTLGMENEDAMLTSSLDFASFCICEISRYLQTLLQFLLSLNPWRIPSKARPTLLKVRKVYRWLGTKNYLIRRESEQSV